MEKRENISMSIIKRLPRYYRFLQSLKDNGIVASAPRSWRTVWA